MEKQTLKTNAEGLNTIVTRVELAKWYGITERGLQKRMKKAELCIKNRILTFNDLQTIIEKLGLPPMMPSELLGVFDNTVPHSSV
jgi:hypothetical protein